MKLIKMKCSDAKSTPEEIKKQAKEWTEKTYKLVKEYAKRGLGGKNPYDAETWDDVLMETETSVPYSADFKVIINEIKQTPDLKSKWDEIAKITKIRNALNTPLS